MKTTIYQFGTDRYFSDKKLKNLLTLTKERTFEVDKEEEVNLADCDIIDLSVYFYGKNFFVKDEGVGDFKKLRYDSYNKRIFRINGWTLLSDLEEALIELDENPIPKKSYKWLWWMAAIMSIILVGMVAINVRDALANLPEKTENTAETPSVAAGFDFVFETIPVAWFDPEFAIPENVEWRVYVIYFKSQNLSWCYLDGTDVPNNEYSITPTEDGKGIVFEGTDGTIFEDQYFTVGFPSNYDPSDNFMFYFSSK